MDSGGGGRRTQRVIGQLPESVTEIARPARELGFVEAAFDLYWTRHRVKEPTKYFNIREGVAKLREFTGLSQGEIASHLGMTANRLNMIEVRNGPFTVMHFETLLLLCRAYSLPKLAAFFDSGLIQAVGNVKAVRGRRIKSLGDGDTPSTWMSEMGEG